MNDSEYIIKLLKRNNEFLSKIYEQLSKVNNLEPEINFPEINKKDIDLKRLASWIGETYCTTRPELNVETQFNGLIRMTNDYRFERFLLNWLKRKKTEMPEFWVLNSEEQKKYYKSALSQYKDLICGFIKPKLINAL